MGQVIDNLVIALTPCLLLGSLGCHEQPRPTSNASPQSSRTESDDAANTDEGQSQNIDNIVGTWELITDEKTTAFVLKEDGTFYMEDGLHHATGRAYDIHGDWNLDNGKLVIIGQSAEAGKGLREVFEIVDVSSNFLVLKTTAKRAKEVYFRRAE